MQNKAYLKKGLIKIGFRKREKQRKISYHFNASLLNLGKNGLPIDAFRKGFETSRKRLDSSDTISKFGKDLIKALLDFGLCVIGIKIVSEYEITVTYDHIATFEEVNGYIERIFRHTLDILPEDQNIPDLATKPKSQKN